VSEFGNRMQRFFEAARRPLPLLLIVLGSLVVGFLLHAAVTPKRTAAPAADGAEGEAQRVWTCSMHPQIRRTEPGRCPICSMDLVPVEEAGGEAALRQFTTSEVGKALMEIETAPVERRFVTADVRMVGKIDYDETKLAHIAAWAPGRIERLYVDATGVPVGEDEHLIQLYSPELLAAQEEFLQAVGAVEALRPDDSDFMRRSTRATAEAAREKLRLLGLKKEQIDALRESGEASDRLTIHSPQSGIVIDKTATEGMYVSTGTRIYTVADLSTMWAKLHAYESDLSWLRYGQAVEFTSVSYPGRTFEGVVSLIDPVLDPATRTVNVRVNVPNEAGLLKPGMFVRAVVHSRLAAGGKVIDPDLEGKWVCSMHPEVIRDTPGDCEVCGMPLVRAETLGYVADEQAEKPLVIPDTAPLITGRRAVVYVEVPGAAEPTYEGREIVLGPRAGDFFIVRSGLAAGERVVTRGAFKIDSALQIRAQPSAMSPDAGRPVTSHAEAGPATRPALDPQFVEQLGGVFEGYLAMSRALAADDAEAAVAAAEAARAALGRVDMTLVTGDEHMAWMRMSGELDSLLEAAGGESDLQALRSQFAKVSEQVAAVADRFAAPTGPLYEIRCPMAFDGRGATWLQTTPEVSNPYFGDVMPKCGEVIRVLSPPREGGHPHE